MSDFYGKVATLVPTVSIKPSDTGPANPTKVVQTVGGQTLNLPTRQVPVKNPYRNNNLWRYPASGQYTGLLSTGGQVQIPIIRSSGSGRVKDTWLRLVVTNDNGSANNYVPVPLWINNIVIQNPSGSTIQTIDGTALWLSICGSFDQDSWVTMIDDLLSSDDYEKGDPLAANTQYVFYVPLVQDMFAATEWLQPFVDGDMQVYVTFRPQADIQFDPANGYSKLTAISIDMQMEQLPPSVLSATKAMFASERHDFIAPFLRWQRFQNIFGPAQQYSFNLSGIKGDVVGAQFVIRDNVTASPGDLFHYMRIDSFQYTNSEGIGISGQQFIDDVFNRKVYTPRILLGTMGRNRRVYNYIFAEPDHSLLSLWRNGYKAGAYPFSTNENLVINTMAQGQNEIWTVSFQRSGAPQNQGVPTVGNFQLIFYSPDDGLSLTGQLAYNASALTVKAAIEAMPAFNGVATVTSVTTGGGAYGYTIQLSGNYGYRPLAYEGFWFGAMSQLYDAAGAYISLATYVSQFGVLGMGPSATKYLDVYCYTSTVVSMLQNGQVVSYQS